MREDYPELAAMDDRIKQLEQQENNNQPNQPEIEMVKMEEAK